MVFVTMNFSSLSVSSCYIMEWRYVSSATSLAKHSQMLGREGAKAKAKQTVSIFVRA